MLKSKNIISVKNHDLISNRIEKYIEELITNGKLKEGDRLLPEHEIGKLFNASNKPVRVAMQKFVKQGILSKVRGRGTFVRRTGFNKKSSVTNRIGVLYFHSSEAIFASAFYTGLISGIETESKTKQKSLLLHSIPVHPDENPPRVLQGLANDADGFIIIDPPPGFFSLMGSAIDTFNKPVVYLESCENRHDVNAVLPDTEGDVAKVVDFLTGLGHTRIRFVYTPSYYGLTITVKKRLKSFQYAMEEKGLPPDREPVVFNLPSVVSRDGSKDDTLGSDILPGLLVTDKYTQLFKELMNSSGAPTALFCAGDDLALYVYKLAMKTGVKIPDDLTIVGCDGLYYSALVKPPLTTIKLPLEEMGTVAVRRLMEIIKEHELGKFLSSRIALPGRLIERESHRRIE
jgi:GntR family transcriptional regulator, arabinose operon transcriptional repressor